MVLTAGHEAQSREQVMQALTDCIGVLERSELDSWGPFVDMQRQPWLSAYSIVIRSARAKVITDLPDVRRALPVHSGMVLASQSLSTLGYAFLHQRLAWVGHGLAALFRLAGKACCTAGNWLLQTVCTVQRGLQKRSHYPYCLRLTMH